MTSRIILAFTLLCGAVVPSFAQTAPAPPQAPAAEPDYPIVRLGVHPLDADGRTEYPLAIDTAAVGTTRCHQFWFRDLAHLDGTGAGLSAALEVHFGP